MVRGHLDNAVVAKFIPFARQEEDDTAPMDQIEAELSGTGADRAQQMYHKMKDHVNHTHPRRKDKFGVYYPLSICKTNTGYHAMPTCKSDREQGEFERFGVGISLYFKFLKFLAVLYFILMVLAAPSIVVFSLGGKLDDANAQQSILSQTTIGNLGESKVLCRSVNDDTSLSIQCGSGAVIGRVEAYYGQPSGSCDCPTSQLPNPGCPVARVGDSCSQAGGACFFSQLRDVNLPSGESFTSTSCCAKELDPSGLADFTDLDIARNSNCDSPTAERIVKGLCAGKASCHLTVDATRNYTWTPNDTYGTWCKGDTKTRTNSTGGVIDCSETFSSDGGLTNCAGGRFFVGRLVVVAQCFDTEIMINDSLINKLDLVGLIGVLDFFSCIIVLLMWRWLKRKERHAVHHNDMVTATAADYTIMIKPIHQYDSVAETERKLREHFLKFFEGKDRVADINFGLNNGTAVDTARLRGQYLRKIERLNVLAWQIRKKNDPKAVRPTADELTAETFQAEFKKRRMTKTHKRWLAKIKILTHNMKHLQASHAQRAVAAFVTFRAETDALAVLKAYPKDCWSRRCRQPSRLKLDEIHRLRLRRAPEPSDILWENLETSKCGRCWRKSLTAMVSVLVVFITVVLVFISQSVKQENLRKFPAVECSSIVDVANKTLIVPDVLWEKYNQTVGNTGRLECYCKNLLLKGDVSGVFSDEFPEPNLDGSSFWCRTWLETFTINTGLTYGGVAGVLVINMLMRNVLKGMVAFERNLSRTAEMVSVGKTLFVLQLINTAFIYLLVNARIKSNIEWLAIGSYDDFSASWFSTVGVSLLLTMAFNIMVPHIAPVGKLFMIKCNRCRDRGCTRDHSRTKKKTQSAYNKVYSEQTFRFAERYAMSLNTFFVTMAYSTGLPMLLPFAFIGTIVSYWVDKWFFLRFSKTPPAYNESMATFATSMFPYAVFLHVCLGMWMLSNTNIVADEALDAALLSATGDSTTSVAVREGIEAFDPGLNLSKRLFSSHVLPLTLLMLLMIAGAVIWRVVLLPFRGAVTALTMCCDKDEDDEDLPPYFEAIPMDSLTNAVERGGVKTATWKEYLLALERFLYYQAKEHALSQPGATPAIAEAAAIKSIKRFRTRMHKHVDAESAMRASQRELLDLRVDDSELEHAEAGEAPGLEEADYQSWEVLKAFEPPAKNKLMPVDKHSYDIHEIEEYRDAFCLDAYVDPALKIGMSGAQRYQTHHTKATAKGSDARRERSRSHSVGLSRISSVLMRKKIKHRRDSSTGSVDSTEKGGHLPPRAGSARSLGSYGGYAVVDLGGGELKAVAEVEKPAEMPDDEEVAAYGAAAPAAGYMSPGAGGYMSPGAGGYMSPTGYASPHAGAGAPAAAAAASGYTPEQIAYMQQMQMAQPTEEQLAAYYAMTPEQQAAYQQQVYQQQQQMMAYQAQYQAQVAAEQARRAAATRSP